jgi:hypothetical protein
MLWLAGSPTQYDVAHSTEIPIIRVMLGSRADLQDPSTSLSRILPFLVATLERKRHPFSRRRQLDDGISLVCAFEPSHICSVASTSKVLECMSWFQSGLNLQDFLSVVRSAGLGHAAQSGDVEEILSSQPLITRSAGYGYTFSNGIPNSVLEKFRKCTPSQEIVD